jgi:Leucine-rich repeat (LRR) protein
MKNVSTVNVDNHPSTGVRLSMRRWLLFLGVLMLCGALVGIALDGSGNDEVPQTDQALETLQQKAGIEVDDSQPKGSVVAVKFRTEALSAHDLRQLRAFPKLRLLSFQSLNVTEKQLKHLPELPSVQELLLFDATVSGESLQYITRLTNLEVLDLRRQRLTKNPMDAQMAHLACLTKLRKLDLGIGTITDAGLLHLKGLTNLQILYLDDNNIRGDGLQHLKGLNLRCLVLANNQISTGLDHLHGLPKLEELALSNNGIVKGLANLEGLSELRDLSLDRNPISSEELEPLKALTKLHSLRLDKTQVTDDGLRHLKKMSKLQTLYLDQTTVGNEGLKHLHGLPELAELHLSGTKIGDDGLKHLAALPKLRRLYISGTDVSDGALEYLYRLPNLEVLSLSGTKLSTEGRDRLQQTLPKLKVEN